MFNHFEKNVYNNYFIVIKFCNQKKTLNRIKPGT